MKGKLLSTSFLSEFKIFYARLNRKCEKERYSFDFTFQLTKPKQ